MVNIALIADSIRNHFFSTSPPLAIQSLKLPVYTYM